LEGGLWLGGGGAGRTGPPGRGEAAAPA
jgi:hypothetical protein